MFICKDVNSWHFPSINHLILVLIYMKWIHFWGKIFLYQWVLVKSYYIEESGIFNVSTHIPKKLNILLSAKGELCSIFFLSSERQPKKHLLSQAFFQTLFLGYVMYSMISLLLGCFSSSDKSIFYVCPTYQPKSRNRKVLWAFEESKKKKKIKGKSSYHTFV